MSEASPAPETPEHKIIVASDLDQAAELALLNEVSTTTYIPRIEQVQSNSRIRRSMKCEEGEFIHNGNTNFGKEFVAVPAAWRPKAIMFDGDGNMVCESYDPASEVYKTIKMKEAGPKNPKERPGTGGEVLVWCPQYQMWGILPLLKTARRGLKPMYGLIQAKKAALVVAFFVDKANPWWTPNINEYRGELKPTDRPTDASLIQAMALFRSPTSAPAEAEAVDPATTTDRPR